MKTLTLATIIASVFATNAMAAVDNNTNFKATRNHVEVCEISISEGSEVVFQDENVTDYQPAVITVNSNSNRKKASLRINNASGQGIFVNLSKSQVETVYNNGSDRAGDRASFTLADKAELWMQVKYNSTDAQYGEGQVTINYNVSCVQ